MVTPLLYLDYNNYYIIIIIIILILIIITDDEGLLQELTSPEQIMYS